MRAPSIGVPAPRFELPALQNGRRTRAVIPNSDGRCTVLMFFEESGTPLCTTQLRSLNDEAALLNELGATGICISTDPLRKQANFVASVGGLALTLASDEDGRVASSCGVYNPVTKRSQRAAFVIAADVFAALGLTADTIKDVSNG